MIIKKDIDIDGVEEVISELHESNNVSLAIRIPHSIKFKGIGVEAALAQAIITWSRSCLEGELHTYLNKLGSSKHDTFVTSLLGIVSASLAPKISLENHEEVKRFDFLKPASEMIKHMDAGHFNHLRRGGEVKLVSISGSSKRFLKSIFKESRKVKEPTYLAGTIRDILKEILPISGDQKHIEKLIESFIPEISWMVFELFQNICDHAEKNEYGEEYPRTIGVLKIAVQKFKNLEEAGRIVPSDSKKYLENIFKNSNNIRFLEVSVLDNGAGLARKWKGLPFDEIEFEEEKLAVIDCLTKGKSRKEVDGHGYGLNNVMEKLKNLNGFLRIRTGRLSVIKTFHNEISIDMNAENFSGQLAAVEGTLISLLIPIRKEA